QKFGFDEARPLLERASARETATRVALGRVAQHFLAQLGITTVSHTVQMGEVAVTDDYEFPTAQDVAKLDADPVRCVDPEVSARMGETVDATKKTGAPLGGVTQATVHNPPVGLRSHIHWDRRLDSKLAGALMGIQAMKGVEIGDGLETAARIGSAAHDAIVRTSEGNVARTTQ